MIDARRFEVTDYAVHATASTGEIVHLPGFPTAEKAQGFAEYLAGSGNVSRASWGPQVNGGYYATASALCAER